MTQRYTGNLVKFVAALAYAISAVSLIVALVLDSYGKWWYGPSLVSGLVFFFLAPCIMSVWLAYLALTRHVSNEEASKQNLCRDGLRGCIGLGIVGALIALQAGAIYNEIVSLERSYPDIDHRIESGVRNSETVDLSDEKQMRLHRLYADAVYVRFGRLHSVADISGEIVEFHPSLNLIETREDYLRSRLNSTLIVSGLSVGFILCFLLLVFWFLCWRFTEVE